ncbi:MAG: hypothetical protein AAGH67_06690 [Cyanobacteria bacterium P01_H01_bin.162]
MVLMPSGHKTHSFGAIAAALGGKALTFGTPAIGIVFGIIDARLIEINPSVGLELR